METAEIDAATGARTTKPQTILGEPTLEEF